MHPRDNTSEETGAVDGESATATENTENRDREGGFIFNNELESDDLSEDHGAKRLAEREQKRIVDIVRLQPTKNTELEDKWGLESGSEVHDYLESELKEYYHRGDDGYIWATEAAEEFAQNEQGVYQDVTNPNQESSNEEVPNLRRRSLVMGLLSLRQELGHLPSPEEINAHGEYEFQRYREEFVDLFHAFQEAGMLPDDVTRSDFYGENEPHPATESDQMAKSESSQETVTGEASVSEQGENTSTAQDTNKTDDDEETESEEIDISELDVARPDFDVPEAFERSDLVEEIQWFADILDEPPTEELVNAYGQYPADAYRAAFGTWEAALETAGCNPNDLPDWTLRKFTNVEVLDVIRAVAAELDRPPTTIETGRRAPFSHGLGSTRFGGWATALELAGLDPLKRPGVGPDDLEDEGIVDIRRGESGGDFGTDKEDSSGSAENVTSEDQPSRRELVEELRRINESRDRITYPSDMNDDGAFSAQTYQNRFGSWDDALEAAGIDKETALLEDMQRVAEKVGEELTQPAMNEHGTYSASMPARFFGSWSDAKDRLAEWQSDQSSQSPQEPEKSEVGQEVEESESGADGEADPIGSVIDDTLEDMLQSDDDKGPF